ncbi:MAG: BamA/TamA family outer membrane protein [Candidatus Latescibacteria bacterium]|nr:BamA/TamA family outer membrane protein [Candidatus Latescibacterota bacterium]
MKKMLFAVCILAMFSQPGFAANESVTPVQGSESVNQEKQNNIRLVPFPVIAYSGTTSLMLGAMLFVNFYDVDNPQAESDSIRMIGAYTLKNQVMAKLHYDKYLFDDAVLNRGRLEYIYFPTEFHGIGTSNSKKDMEEYEYRMVYIDESVLFRLTNSGLPKVWIGPKYAFSNVQYSKLKEDGLLENNVVPGISDTRVSAPGVNFIYDGRDNGSWTTRGNYFETMMSFNTKMLGATQNSASVMLDYRHFWDIADLFSGLPKKNYIFGIHGFYKAQGGDVPLALMSELGGDVILRGYGNRYQDKCKYAAESEIRYPIWKAFSGTVFGGFGDVAEGPVSFNISDTHFAGGLGLRIALAEGDDKINIRLDVAYTREHDVDVCFDVMEAF